MKARKFLFFLSFVMVLFVSTTFVCNAQVGKGERGANNTGGMCMMSFSMSMAYTPVSIAVESGAFVNVSFSSDYGFVDVVIRDNNDSVVYTESVNTYVQHQSLIAISALASGNYTVAIIDANGSVIAETTIDVD